MTMVRNSPRLTVAPGLKHRLSPTCSPEKMPVLRIHSAVNRQVVPAVSEYWRSSLGLRIRMVTVASRDRLPAGSVAVKVKESTPTLFLFGV